MPDLAHADEIEVGATPEQVWRAITDPQLTRRYVYGCDIEGEWRPGGRWRYHTAGRTAVEGEVLEARPPHLLRLTASNRWDPAAAGEPPHRMTWSVEPTATPGRSRVSLAFDGFTSEAAGQREGGGASLLLVGLRNVVDPEAALRRLDQIGDITVEPLAASSDASPSRLSTGATASPAGWSRPPATTWPDSAARWSRRTRSRTWTATPTASSGRRRSTGSWATRRTGTCPSGWWSAST